MLTNPALNYAQFLLRAILPTVLHVMIAIAAGFAVGSEFGGAACADWLETAGGSPLTALVGKLAPYFGIFILIMAVGLGIIHGVFQIPFRGDPVMTGAAACLLILAYLSLGALFQLLVQNLATGLTLTAIVCSPAFGFAGVGFPVLAMGAFARDLGNAAAAALVHPDPVRSGRARGSAARSRPMPFAISRCWPSSSSGSPGCGCARSRGSRRRGGGARTAPTTTPHGIVGFFAAEYGRVLRDSGAFGLIVLGPILYGVLYPQPYLGQLIRHVPIAVVDDDAPTSAARCPGAECRRGPRGRAASHHPGGGAGGAGAPRRVRHPGHSGRHGAGGAEGRHAPGCRPMSIPPISCFTVARCRASPRPPARSRPSLRRGGARPDGSLYRAALARNSPVEILNQPLFNPTGGYASYIVPAAFLLILQQTLLMGSATLGGVAFEQGGFAARRRRGTPAAVIGQALAHLLLALPGCALYLVVLPRLYGFSYTERLLDLLVLVIPFILSISFLGQLVGAAFRRRETAVLLLIAVSLPIFFLVGVAWPPEAIPPVLRALGAALPSTSGIEGLVRVNQMGASFGDVFARLGAVMDAGRRLCRAGHRDGPSRQP